MSTFRQTDNHAWSCRTSILEVPPFTKWVISSSFEVILATPSRHCTTGTFSSGTSVSRWLSLILLHERIRRRSWWCNFSTLIDIVAETAIVSFHTLPVGFPLPTISKNSLSTLFCPLILAHGVLLKISISDPKNSYFECLARYFFSPKFSICDNQVLTSSDESYNSNTVLSFSDSRILNLYNPSKMSSCGIFVIDDKIPSHLESNSWISSLRRTIVNKSV